MQTKNVTNSQFKLLDDSGSFTAVFSFFNVVDKQGDITLPGAFTEGEKVKISAWGHAWSALPIGRGVIHSDSEKAWCDGEFFLSTSQGKDAYETIKGLSDLNEFSYGFDVLDSENVNGHRVLKKLRCFEVSPVMIGAGNNTRLESIKSHYNQGTKALLTEINTLKQKRDYQLLNEIRRLKAAR